MEHEGYREGVSAMKFRKKPVVIEAVQFGGDNFDAVRKFLAPIRGKFSVNTINRRFFIDTLEGTMEAEPGDWIIRGIKGEFYPCKPDIFEATYEPVAEKG
jgi:hypothetical protein